MVRFTCLEFAFAYFNSIRTEGELSFLADSDYGFPRRITLTDDGFWCSARRYNERQEAL